LPPISICDSSPDLFSLLAFSSIWLNHLFMFVPVICSF
jgi:hypothetical protein